MLIAINIHLRVGVDQIILCRWESGLQSQGLFLSVCFPALSGVFLEVGRSPHWEAPRSRLCFGWV